eukprot:SAG22_NODE_592_length_8810_cov_3.873264_5_plen_490_part_00
MCLQLPNEHLLVPTDPNLKIKMEASTQLLFTTNFESRPLLTAADMSYPAKVLVVGETTVCEQLQAAVPFVAFTPCHIPNGRELSEVELGEALKRRVCFDSWDVIVFAQGLDGRSCAIDRITAEQDYSSFLLLALLQTLQSEPASCSRGLIILTQGVQIFTNVMTDATRSIDRASIDVNCITHAPLWGIAKTARLEIPALTIKCVDVAVNVPKPEIAALVSQEVLDLTDCDVLIGRSGREVPRIAHQPKLADIAAYSAPSGWIALIGGNGALGLIVAKWLVSRGAKRLLLVSRSGSVRAEFDAAWQELQVMPDVEAQLVKCDVSDQAAVKKFVARYADALGGVIHCAGVLDDKMLPNQTRKSFKRVYSAKAHAALFLHLALREHGVPPGNLFAVFSSVTALMGNRGQTNYGGANAFLDALAGCRRVMGMSGISLQWGPWAEVGMAKDLKRKMVWEKVRESDAAVGRPTAIESPTDGLLTAAAVWSGRARS